MIVQPVFIPHRSEPSRCPNCNEIESTDIVCNHCGYHYPKEGTLRTFWVVLILLSILLIGGWIMWTLIDWFTSSPQKSLMDILRSQWDFITHMRIK